MSRKTLKSMGRDTQRRRSPRISALDCNKSHQNRQLSRTSTRMKRKSEDSAFTPVSKLAKQVWKGRESPQNADHSTDFVEWRSIREPQMARGNQKQDDYAKTNGKPSALPAKNVLELVIDTLQRRDTYEIFAEPVDPDEVDDYYEIIKEPMDFGTMRAKLHEGMYENLEQFEHDVFLIPENAMHFNSSATIYFRQARAIHELAKKVFHVLKTDPGNFVSEFSGTRRRSMRKALRDGKDSRFPIAKSSVVCSQGTLQCPSTSTFLKTSKKSPGMTNHSHARNFLTGNAKALPTLSVSSPKTFSSDRCFSQKTGSKDSRISSSGIADRRFTYLFNEDLENPTFYSSCKSMVLMNQGDISYNDSLMSYVKDLGPTAKMVANRKLLGQHESSSSRIGQEKCQNSSVFVAKELIGSKKCQNSGGFVAKELVGSKKCQNSGGFVAKGFNGSKKCQNSGGFVAKGFNGSKKCQNSGGFAAKELIVSENCQNSGGFIAKELIVSENCQNSGSFVAKGFIGSEKCQNSGGFVAKEFNGSEKCKDSSDFIAKEFNGFKKCQNSGGFVAKDLIGSEKCQNSGDFAAKELIGSKKCQNSGGFAAKEFKTFRDFAPAGCNPFLKAREVIIDLTKDGEEADDGNKRRERAETETDNGNPGKQKIDMPKRVTAATTRNPLHVGKDLNCSTSRGNKGTSSKDEKVRPVILALENSHSNMAEYKSRNKKSSILPPPLVKPRPACGEAQQQQQRPKIAQFAFDLPFLKARLNQMNAVAIGGKLSC